MTSSLPWERWIHWQSGDRRWQVNTFDTSDGGPVEAADWPDGWIDRQVAAWRAGHLPLSGTWWR